MKLAILVTHPVQYFAPVFRALAGVDSLQVKVFYGCDHGTAPQLDPDFGVAFQWDCYPTRGYDSVFLSSGSLDSLRGFSGIRLGLLAARMVADFTPDAVLVFAYSPAFITAATVQLAKAGYKLFLRAETTDVAAKRSLAKGFLRDTWLRYYYRQFAHFLPIGTHSREHFIRLGVPEESMTTVPYAVDTDFMQAQVEQWKPRRDELRAELGIASDDKVLMFCGKMFPPKDPLIIPEAISLLPLEIRNRIWLLAVGDGVLRARFEEQAKKIIGERAVFVGFQNQTCLGKYYALADTLILPSVSGETWGLVVNEALQFGLTALVSDRVGCGPDLIRLLSEGNTFAAGDPQDLANAVIQACAANSPSMTRRQLPQPKRLAEAIYSKLQSE